MAVKIRLSRIGKKKVPFFRIVAVDERRKRDGAFLADIGTYDALKGKVIRFDEALMKQWVSQGAIPTDTVKRIVKLVIKKEAKKAVAAAPKKAATPKKKKVVQEKATQEKK